MYEKLAFIVMMLIGAVNGWAGGPSPGVRLRCLGQCGNGEACVNQAATISAGCFGTDDELGFGTCGCVDAQCTMAATGVFTGELTVSINEDCPAGLPGARVTMHLTGQTDARVGFDAITAAPLDFCDVDIASSCANDSYRSPFFCSNNAAPDFVPDAEFPDRLHE